MKKISLSQITVQIPFEFNIQKDIAVLNWLIKFREFLLKEKKATFGDIIPSKNDIARYLRVSTGTVQSAVRYAEDMGLFVSKQCIGTMISDKTFPNTKIKMKSKKDKTVLEIKKLIFFQKYKKEEIIPTLSEIASELKISLNTVRLAIFELIENGILRKEVLDNKTVLILNKEIKLTEREKNSSSEIKNKTTVKQIYDQIKKYLVQNFKTGEKIPPNSFFAKEYNVSTRTINLAMKELNKDKIILSRRGKYGSVFLNTSLKEAKLEKSIFMSKPKGSKDINLSYSYKWEQTLKNLTKYINKNHESGDKIPSMKELSKILNVSVTTIKRAVKELVKDQILYVQKGKYGGLFIYEMPQKEDAYQWLAVNPDYFGEN